MSALQTLRNKAGLLVSIVIGFALVAFILGDFLSSNKSSSADDRVIAKINGRKIPVEQYFNVVNQLEDDYKNRSGANVTESTRNYLLRQAWEQILRESLMDDQFRQIGLGVDVAEHGILGITPEELKDIVLGNHVDPQIQQIFANPETGQYDRTIALNFLQNMDKDPQRKAIWLGIEKTLMQNQLGAKYNALVTKGLYVTNKEAEMLADEKNVTVSFDYAGLRYSNIPDSTVSINENEVKQYYDKNKEKYKSEPYRDIKYVVFDVKPSQEDYAATEKWCADMVGDFQLSEDDQLFVSSNSDLPYAENLYSEDNVPAVLDSIFFYQEKGAVVGPYFENGYYKLAKLSDKVFVPDSVHARHILIKSGDAQNIADSLKGLIEGGADFEILAKEFSEDPGSGSKGGDLGWFTYGAMVKSFNDTCFYGNVGKIYTAYSRHGIHLIEILGKGAEVEKIKVSILGAEVRPSTATVNKVYGEAGRFVGESQNTEAFLKNAEQKGFASRVAKSIKRNDRFISGQVGSRAVVKWAFESEVGTVSDVFDVEQKFIVACLTGANDEDFDALDNVRSSIEIELKKEKKADVLKTKFSDHKGKSVAEIASAVSAQMNSSAEISFDAVTVPGVGREPMLVGSVVALEAGKVSEPLRGDNGVYVVAPTATNKKTVAQAVSEKANAEKNLSNSFARKLQETLKDISDIEDNRFSFE